MFIIVDGIDGSGKSTIVQAWKNYLANQGNAIFDLKKYLQKNTEYPSLDEIKSYDIVFNCEPTYSHVGRVVRHDLIHNGNGYSAQAIAQGYSLDRLILYKKIIIPLLKNGKLIIQDRGIPSSIAYQPLQDKKLTIGAISKLPGNALALKYRPDHLVIAKIDPRKALGRLNARSTKKDDAIFEQLGFQKKLAAMYVSKTFQNVFAKRGTKLHYLNAEAQSDIMETEAVELLKKIIK